MTDRMDAVCAEAHSAIQLREPENRDVPQLAAAVQGSLADLQPWLAWATPAYSVAHAQWWVGDARQQRAAGTAYEFVITDAADQVVGACGLNRIDAENRMANLGYWVASRAAGQGIAARAVQQLTRWAFGFTGLHRLEIVAAVGNARSLRVADKAAAIREAVLRDRLWLHGAPHDAVLYSILRPALATADVRAAEAGNMDAGY